MTDRNLPLVVDMVVYHDKQFMEDIEIKNYIDKVHNMYKQCKKRFVLRVCGKLATDLDTLNKKIHTAYECLPERQPILVQLSFERMILLAQREDTVFLKPRVFPSVLYHVQKDFEDQCLSEITQLLDILRQFVDIRVVVSLSIENPLPNISKILEYLRKQCGFVKLVEFVMERSPSKIVESIQHSKRFEGLRSNVYIDVMDPYDVIKHIADNSTMTKITKDDFFPATMAAIFEPFIDLMGLGSFSIRPSPLCAFGTCLINAEETESVPISQLIDFEKFYEQMKPLIPEIALKGVGFFSARSIKKILKRCAIVKLPDILSIVRQKSKADLVNSFIQNLQYIVIHNHMDISNVDMVRRCQCASVGLDENRFISTCTGCL